MPKPATTEKTAAPTKRTDCSYFYQECWGCDELKKSDFNTLTYKPVGTITTLLCKAASEVTRFADLPSFLEDSSAIGWHIGDSGIKDPIGALAVKATSDVSHVGCIKWED